ncbi:flagellar biosynthesis anti-sigma factor FlgM [Heliobacterium mobile]|nr:flagellar biosynthesis anti-sigma factor FlgM [Heliobacterium mobile]
MIHSSNLIQHIRKAYSTEPVTKRAESIPEPKGGDGIKQSPDLLSLSEEARLLQGAMKAIQDVPEIRMDKVLHVQEALRTGTYSISGEEIAEKMIGSK